MKLIPKQNTSLHQQFFTLSAEMISYATRMTSKFSPELTQLVCACVGLAPGQGI
jgi:hypothetical protein